MDGRRRPLATARRARRPSSFSLRQLCDNDAAERERPHCLSIVLVVEVNFARCGARAPRPAARRHCRGGGGGRASAARCEARAPRALRLRACRRDDDGAASRARLALALAPARGSSAARRRRRDCAAALDAPYVDEGGARDENHCNGCRADDPWQRSRGRGPRGLRICGEALLGATLGRWRGTARGGQRHQSARRGGARRGCRRHEVMGWRGEPECRGLPKAGLRCSQDVGGCAHEEEV